MARPGLARLTALVAALPADLTAAEHFAVAVPLLRQLIAFRRPGGVRTLGDAFRPPKPVRKPRPKKPSEWGSAFEPVVKQKSAPKAKR